jgi:hypothetical protein
MGLHRSSGRKPARSAAELCCLTSKADADAYIIFWKHGMLYGMQNNIINLIGVIQILEGFYILYLIPNHLGYFPSNIFIVIAVTTLISILLLILSGIGLLQKRNEAIILSLFLVILQLLLIFIKLPILVGNYTMPFINTFIVIYLLTRWNKLKNI